MKHTCLFFLLFVLSPLFAQETNLVQYVNTLQGTNSKFELSKGNTYATIALPFANHTWGAQTGRNGNGWKYQYTADSIRGFQQAHQCSPWTEDYATFSLMPVTGKLAVDQFARAAKFSHKNETAKPNYYKVTFDNKITTEISPVERGAHIRFTFPPSESYVIFDGYIKMSNVKIYPDERKITGWVNNARGVLDNFKNYFVIIFDKPFVSYGTWENQHGKISKGEDSREGRGAGAYVQFKDGETVQAKVASSYISPEQALLNLTRELGSHNTLEDTKNQAAKIWNAHLGRILVEGGTEEQKATFYSCFFRASLFSRQFFDYGKDGKPYYYSPYDGKIHDGYMFTDNGFWDTFRSQFPLNTILYPTMHGRYMNAMLDMQEQFGWLPAWSFPSEGGSMIGNHAISLLADAWVKGIRTFDPQKALDAYYHEVTNKGPRGPANGRDGYQDYLSLGYVAYPGCREATAKTLEYAYDDFCGYQLAKSVNNQKYQDFFSKSMYNYKNVFDPSTTFMRGRQKDGQWVPNFDPVEWGGAFTEGNSWHYTWSVFQDINGLINLIGGEKRFVAKMDSVFSVPNTVKVGTYGGMIHEMAEMVVAEMGQYAHGNQPIQHMPYLYNYARQPWKTQFHVREIMEKLYNSTENGFSGDEDQGGMSSWYVLSALGLYSVCPGTDQYVIGSPVFEKTTITLEDGKKFVIEAKGNNKENVYIQASALNGTPYTHNWIRYADVVKGGTLHFDMGNKPALNRGIKDDDIPFSLSTDKEK